MSAGEYDTCVGASAPLVRDTTVDSPSARRLVSGHTCGVCGAGKAADALEQLLRGRGLRLEAACISLGRLAGPAGLHLAVCAGRQSNVQHAILLSVTHLRRSHSAAELSVHGIEAGPIRTADPCRSCRAEWAPVPPAVPACAATRSTDTWKGTQGQYQQLHDECNILRMPLVTQACLRRCLPQVTDPRGASNGKWDCFASYRLALVHPSSEAKTIARDSWHRFSGKKKSHGWCDFAPAAAVLDPQQGFSVNDSVVVSADILVLNESVSFTREAELSSSASTAIVPVRAANLLDGPCTCYRAATEQGGWQH